MANTVRRKRTLVEQQSSKNNPSEVEAQTKSLVWSPNLHTTFKILLSARICSAIWSHISDCDETFNYWEPMHYLLHGYGFQTWEYSPAYAIRSYAYIWLYMWPLKIYSSLFAVDKLLQFYLLRCILAFICTLCETYFYKTIQVRLGDNIARLTLFILLFNPGMYTASVAFLPSSFAMYSCFLFVGAWIENNAHIAVFCIAVGSLIGWPFAIILGIPFAMNYLFVKRNFLKFFTFSFLSLVICLTPLILIDSSYYGKLVITPLNILIYNVFSQHGSELYGTEPFSYYLVNCFLNFNLSFILALIAIPILVLTYMVKKRDVHYNNNQVLFSLLILSAMSLWMLIFFTRPHKEERFLFPIYPLISLAAAITLDSLQKFFSWVLYHKSVRHYTDKTNVISISFLIIYTLLSLSRIFALYFGYHSTMDVYRKLYQSQLENDDNLKNQQQKFTICVGKDWYRFPSNFFLHDKFRMQFIKSEFRGQLPKAYSTSEDATSLIPSHMNDFNLEEMERYVNVSICDYLVDMDTGKNSRFEPNYSSMSKIWSIFETMQFIDSSKSHPIFRAFYIPFLWSKNVQYSKYNILASRKLKNLKKYS